MKKFILMAVALLVFTTVSGCNNNNRKTQGAEDTEGLNTGLASPVRRATKETKIQVAILLDTSNSMDGLIDQAKARLWNIVNTLTTLKYKGETPRIEIALYEYGNNNIPTDDYVRLVTPLTTDLDMISEKLFSLTTCGGLEYCGAVIQKAVGTLDWGMDDADMKLIYIAGNEPFTQGNVHYKKAIQKAVDKKIYVNTIHCGDLQEGLRDLWKDGAEVGKGKFFNIDHDRRVRHYDTPYDQKISEYNVKLNETYMGYGRMGDMKKESQRQQDANAQSVSSANYAERAVTKTKKAYNNSSWDLVDKVKENPEILAEMEEAELPAELQGKTKEEMTKVVKEKEKERSQLQKQIAELAEKRQQYINEQMRKEGESSGDDLGEAINQSVMELAMAMGYEIEK